MFLLVSVRHIGAHPGEHQHGVSIQISINLAKTFLRISRIRNIPLSWILAGVFAYVPPFISHILDFICEMVLMFILIYFEWSDTENQQYRSLRLPPFFSASSIREGRVALSVGHSRGTHSRYVIGCCLIPVGIWGLKNNSRRITYGIGCVWGMPSLSPLSCLGKSKCF